MKKMMMIAAALLLCAAAPADAQEASASEIQAVREMLEVSRTHENFVRGMELGMEQGGMGELTPAVRKALRDFMDEYFAYEQLEPELIRIYTEQFTEDEIRALTAFYRTPAGAKLMERTPELMAAIQQVTMSRMAEHMPVLMQRITAAMEEDEGT